MNLLPILPLIVLAGTSIIVMLSIALKRNYTLSFILTTAGLAASFISLFYIPNNLSPNDPNLFVVDDFALFYIGLLVAAAFMAALLSYSYFKKYEGSKEEYYIILILGLLGSTVLVCSNHLVSFFLGLELLSVSLYVLISYTKEFQRSIEAGVKYLILAAGSSAFLLFGMALLYTEYGSMEFSSIAFGISAGVGISFFVLAGFAMIIVGIGFKLAVVPFHMWTPDIYEGAPAPVSAFIASVSKGGMMALLMRFFFEIDMQSFPSLILIFTIISAASMIAGNLLALLQKNVKRILAYSSIAHFGYFLVAFVSDSSLAAEGITFYLCAYFITIIGAFGIITFLSGSEGEPDNVDDFKGLFWSRPFAASIFTAMLLSLAGIPITAGFIGKYLVLASGVNSALWFLSIVLVATSVIGLYYYLRIITSMFSSKDISGGKLSTAFSLGGIALIIVTLLLIWFGVYPSPFMDLIKIMVGNIA